MQYLRKLRDAAGIIDDADKSCVKERLSRLTLEKPPAASQPRLCGLNHLGPRERLLLLAAQCRQDAL